MAMIWTMARREEDRRGAGVLEPTMQRLHRLGSRLRGFLQPAPIGVVPSCWDYLRLRPRMFTLWFRLRKLRHRAQTKLTRAGIHWRQIEFGEDSAKAHLVQKVIPHNIKNMWLINRDRTERLIIILRTIRGIDCRKSRVLCIGPRNEAEVLLLSLYGFPLRNISAIDLFSYTPLIQVMDMHNMEFDDSEFDIVYSSFVVRYSNDLPRVCQETVRVARDRGLVAIGFVYPRANGEDPLAGTKLRGGLKELYGYFGDHIRHVFWQEEFSVTDRPEVIATTIFSISK